MKKISIMIFIMSFLLYRPYVMQKTGMLYKGDDETYFSYAASIAYFQFPSFRKELVKSPSHFIGSGVLAAPFVFAFSMIDRVLGSSIVEERNAENVAQSWSLFGFVFASIFYFYIGCYLLYKAMRICHAEEISVMVVFFMVIVQGVPLYVYRRPVFSHLFEFFVQSALVFILLRQHTEDSNYNGKIYQVLLIGFLVGMLSLVRFNDAIYSLIWPIAIYGFNGNKTLTLSGLKKILAIYGILLIPLILFIVWPGVYNKEGALMVTISRTESYASNIFKLLIRGFTYKSLFRVVFSLDWGMFFTAPFVIISSISLFLIKSKFRKALFLMSVPIAFNFCIFVLARGSHGSWYGYRYFIYAAIPLLVMPMADFIKYMGSKHGKKIYYAIGLISVFPLLSMLCFEGNANNLTLHLSNQWGGWNNSTYQFEIWKTIFFNPFEIGKAILKGGPLYVIYLISLPLGLDKHLPGIVLSKYSEFNAVVLIKSIVIFSLPLIMSSIVAKSNSMSGQRKIQKSQYA